VIDDRPSRTAQFVAAMRALGTLLPDAAQLADDPWGARVSPPPVRALAALSRRAPSLRPLLRVAAAPLLPSVAYMQVRTRLIDDTVRRFCRSGGRQLVILGAGYDARAARLGDDLDGARVFEVDHPATQRRKRERFGMATSSFGGVEYVAWDFEHDAMAALPSRLGELGLDRARPSLTLWEGVTMYLTEDAIAATVAAVRAWSTPGSQLCFSYFDRRRVERPSAIQRVVATGVRVLGEPFRFGWDPDELPAWMTAHGMRLVADDDLDEAAHRLLPATWARLFRHGGRHVAVAKISIP
jgi:methyltransferase (TIGR00027 family)